jgi:hypothetical protein
MKNTVLSVFMHYIVIKIYCHFGGPRYLHLQGEDITMKELKRNELHTKLSFLSCS